jgi:hypothetical protein
MRRFLQLIRPLRMPLLFVVILAGWPVVLPLAWLALITFLLIFMVRGKR